MNDQKSEAARPGGSTHTSNTHHAAPLDEVKVAAFNKCTDQAPIGEMTLPEIAETIRGNGLISATEGVRQALTQAGGDKKNKSVVAAKMLLPCVSLSGTGPGHKERDLEKHSGLVQMDFDGPKHPGPSASEDQVESWRRQSAVWVSRLPMLRDKVKACPHVALAFYSATGTGIKAALRVATPEGMSPQELQRWHREIAFPAVERFATENFQAQIDSTCIDAMRLAFLSHDPDVYYNPEAIPLPISADSADNAEPCSGDGRQEFQDAMRRSQRREEFAKWASECGFTGDLRELDVEGLLADHGITAVRKSKGLAIQCLWEGEHSTGSNGTDTMLLDSGDEGSFRWGFKCQHEHCRHRNIRDFLRALESRQPGSVDARCRKSYAQGQVHQEAESDEPVTALAFPLDALSPVARRIVTDSAEIADVDITLTGSVALAVIAAAIGRGAVAQGGTRDLSKTTPANLFIIPAFPTGYGKTSAEPILAPIREINTRLQEQFDREERAKLQTELAECEAAQKRISKEMAGVAWRKNTPDQANALRKELTMANTRIAALQEQVNLPPQRIIGSAPGAALAQAMKRNNECLFSFGYESGDILRIALGRFAKDGRGDCDLLLSAYTGDPFHENRVSRANIRLEHPNLTALWLCQPAILTEMLTSSEARERGMLNRMLYAICPREHIPHEQAEARQPDQEARRAWAEAIEKIDVDLFNRNEPLIFPVSAEAREVFRALHNKSVDARNGSLRDESEVITRLRENAIRLALGQAVLDFVTGVNPFPTIEAGHAERGAALAEWSLSNLLAFLGPARFARRQQRFAALVAVLQGHRGEATLRVLRDNHGFGNEEVRELARRFPSQIRIESRGSRRPSEVAVLVTAAGGKA